MAKQFLLKIMTPTGLYLSGKVDSISLRAEHSTLQILPNHAPLVSTLLISEMAIVCEGKKEYYAIGGGVVYVKKEETILLLDSIEKSSDIDVNRANAAKIRAESRLKDKKDTNIDYKRAEIALMRAINRLSVANRNL